MKVWRRIWCLMVVLIGVGLWSAVAVAAEPVSRIRDEDLSSLRYGARIVINEGTTYYASADMNGSGNTGKIGNQYTPMGTDLYVGGFALLNEAGRLQDYDCYNPKDVPVADDLVTDDSFDWGRVWIGFFLSPEDKVPTGWVPARSIVVLNGLLGDGGSNERFKNGIMDVEMDDSEDLDPEIIDNLLPDPGNVIEDKVIGDRGEQEDDDSDDLGMVPISTREIAYAIEDYADSGEKVALLLDASGSVIEHMSDIADYGVYVDKVNKADVVITFGSTFAAIAVEDYMYTDVGGTTDIYTPLNSLLDIESYDRIILVTDTQHNEDTMLQERDEFAGKMVIVLVGDMVDIYTRDDIEQAFNTTIYWCRLDNELERMRAMEALTK